MKETLPVAEQPAANRTAIRDDAITICVISMVASMLATMLHEGLGHAAIAIATLHASGTLTTVAWSSTSGSKLVLAGGTLVNLAAALVCWLLLHAAENASPGLRFFLFITMTFNLFAGTGYFFYSGVSNFGDWAGVIEGMHPYWLWRVGLVALGVLTYYGAMRLVGGSLVRYFGVATRDHARFRRLTWLPYFTALILEGIAGLRNPFGVRFVFESALAATAGANCALLFLVYYVPRTALPGPNRHPIARNYAWIALAVVLAVAFIIVFGPGVHLRG